MRVGLEPTAGPSLKDCSIQLSYPRILNELYNLHASLRITIIIIVLEWFALPNVSLWCAKCSSSKWSILVIEIFSTPDEVTVPNKEMATAPTFPPNGRMNCWPVSL